jgi:DMSO/TMAO reductase YedYZ heme-binding membrane subunit
MRRAPVIVLAIYTILAIVFYYFNTGVEVAAFFRGLGISGFTFFAISLMITPLAMFVPRLSRFVAYRTEAGVFGATLIAIHVIILLLLNVHEDIFLLVAGSIAFLIYLVMIATTGAKNIQLIGFQRWRTCDDCTCCKCSYFPGCRIFEEDHKQKIEYII